jgi:uncharacterized protein (DUF342 family)
MDAVQVATTEFLNAQISALQEALEKKDVMIISLQDRSSENSQKLYTERNAHQATKNSVKEYVLESLKNGDMSHEIAEALAEICAFELTKTVIVNAVIEFDVEIEVPFDVDADDVASTLEFSVDSFDYSIDNYDVNERSMQAEDNIS